MSARTLFEAATARARLDRCRRWLDGIARADRVVIVGASMEAAAALSRSRAQDGGSTFGAARTTLARLALEVALPELARLDIAPIGPLGAEAMAARVVHRLARDRQLGRFTPIAGKPGFSRAVARTLHDLRLGGIGVDALEGSELAPILAAYESELASTGLGDHATVLTLATARAAEADHPLLGTPLLFLDAPVRHTLEARLACAIARRSPRVLATIPAGDERTRNYLAPVLAPESSTEPAPKSRLARLQHSLFQEISLAAPEDTDSVEILTAPTESRECVEIARSILERARNGVPFERMAILLRTPGRYRAHVDEALRRAGIPAYSMRGTLRPDPSGRAFLALLGCAASGLSARHFAEYLSLGEVPRATSSREPPPAAPREDRWIDPEDEQTIQVRDLDPRDLAEDPSEESRIADTILDPDAEPVIEGGLRQPRRWERLLVDAAVIGGIDRWRRRLSGLEAQLRLELGAKDLDEARKLGVERSLTSLIALREFALPLLDALAALPEIATWREWLDQLSALATRALRKPERVLALLAELEPMAAIGDVHLGEVREALSRRLVQMVTAPIERRSGRVTIAPIDAVRGLDFDAVFVPGLSERMFPERVSEDPLLRDAARRKLSPEGSLETNVDRIEAERLALRMAAGAASSKLVLSFPRLDTDQPRPRMPSFYALEAVRAAEGVLPGFDELEQRAKRGAAPRLGWPAPSTTEEAIDESEHDLVLLDHLFGRPEKEGASAASFLVGSNPNLGRALRMRARRALKSWNSSDGLAKISDEGRAALSHHRLSVRTYSPTVLEIFATCPYKFFLRGIQRLSPTIMPEAMQEMDAREKGSLMHEVQFELLGALRLANLLPVTELNMGEARALLEVALAQVAVKFEERLAPAIDRVWHDTIQGIRSDLIEWLRRATESPDILPWRFELAFGLGEHEVGGLRQRDPDSRAEPVTLEAGLKLRGSIDLVERDGAGILRATDHKSGKARVGPGSVIAGGKSLQPALYALVLEKLFPEHRVSSGRLYYCTTAAGFEAVEVPLDQAARDAVKAVTTTIDIAIETGMLPRAPDRGACEYCDYQSVCGSDVEERMRRVKKKPEDIEALVRLREMR